jgi:branched-chain amino acid transport system permease protein
MNEGITFQERIAATLSEQSSLSLAVWGAAVVLGVISLGYAAVDRPGLVIDNLIGGFVYGMILVLIALGLALILGLMNVVNFAHGALFMAGAYIAYHVVAVLGLSFWVALVVAPLAVGVVGILMEVLVLRRVYGQEPIVGLLATFGMTLMFQEAVRAIWGSTPLRFDTPALLDGPLSLGVTSVGKFRLFAVAVSVIAVVATYLIVTRTTFGLSVRSGVQDPEMSEFLGINIPLRFTAMFFLGATIAGLGGVLRGAEVGMQPDLGASFIILTFIVVVVGGVGSLFGSVVAGLLIGEAVFLFPLMVQAMADLTGLEFLAIRGIGGLVPYLVMIVILMVRPRGFFGTEGFLE